MSAPDLDRIGSMFKNTTMSIANDMRVSKMEREEHQMSISTRSQCWHVKR